MPVDADFWETLNHYYNDVILFHVQDVGITVSHLVVALVSVLLSIVGSVIIRGILKKKVFRKMKIDEGVEYALLRLIHFLVLTLGVYIGLQTINIPLGAFVGLFAVIGVGIGFGLQSFAADITSGIIILWERPFKVGDRLEREGIWGDVKDIKLRTTLIMTPDDIAMVVPNSKLTNEAVINYSYGNPRIRLHVPVGVAYGSDVETVKGLLLQAAKEHDGVMMHPPPAVWFREFGDSSLNFQLLCWVPRSEQKFQVMSDLNFRIDQLFRENGIEIPFPQRDLHLRSSDVKIGD